jgi:hypothetical protein
MDDLARRLRDAGSALLGLRDALVAGEPWPLSDSWGTEPEARWGPPELLAHVNEMLPYWVDQLETVLRGNGTAAVPFGRVATDPGRLSRIGTDRQRPIGDLLDDIASGLERAGAFAAGLSAEDAARRGRHSTRGELSVAEAIERFLAGHLEEHVDQLRDILARPAG